MNKEQQRGAIHFLFLKHYTAEQIHQELQQTVGQDAYSLSEVYYWIKEIKSGRADLNNIPPPENRLIRQLDQISRNTLKNIHFSAQGR